MLAVKGSKREELQYNYKDTEKKNCYTVGSCFLQLCYEMESQEGGKVGEKGSGKLVMEKKNQSMIKQKRETDYWKRIGILAAT